MRTAARYALCFAAAFVICVLAFPVVVSVLSPLGTVLDAVSERWLSSLMAPGSTTEPSKATYELPEQAASCDIDPVLSSLEKRDPIEAARAAIHRGNLVLLGVHGDTVAVPGVSDDLECWADRQGVLPIPGTSDHLLCAEQARLQGVADSFAAKYNDFLAEELRRRFPGICTA
jgi:hypothetical protein